MNDRSRSGTSLETSSERSTVRLAALLVAALAVAVAWTPDRAVAETDAPLRAASDTTVTVDLVNYDYEPNPIRVRRGDTLRLVNATHEPHNAVFGEVPDGARLESKEIGPYLIQKGDSYELVIDEDFVPGTYEIYCTPHKALGMTGKVIVESAPADPTDEGEAEGSGRR